MKALLVVLTLAFVLACTCFTEARRERYGTTWEEKTSLKPWQIYPRAKPLYSLLAERFGWKQVPAVIPFDCEVCLFTMGTIQSLLQENASVDLGEEFFSELCVLLEVEVASVCDGLASEFGPEVVEILTTRFLSPLQICTYFLICTNNDTVSLPTSYSPSTTSCQPATFTSHSVPSAPEKKIKSRVPTGHFMHITDIHHDPLYQAGSNVNCDTPLCCRAQYGSGNASVWGEYNCDANLLMLQNAFSYIAQAFGPQLDFIVWTGDNPPHDVWEESQQGQINYTRTVVDILLEYFPDTPIFPAIGNHESFPVDQFPGPPRNNWLMGPTADFWSTWLPADALETVRIGAYYTTLIYPGLRVVAINTMYCDINNFWMVLNETDPSGQLAWLDNVLTQAAQAGEKVYLLGHIPMDESDCLYIYSSKIEILVRKHAATILAQFYGHSHHDDFFLYHAAGFNTSAPIGVAFIAPSLTPYTNINPSFRIYDYNTSTGDLLDYHQYHMDLNKTNCVGYPTWFEYYSARAAYNLSSLNFVEWQNLIEVFKANDTLFQEYYSRHITGTPISPCTGKCKVDYVCSLQAGTFKEQFECSGDEYNLSNLWPWIINHLD